MKSQLDRATRLLEALERLSDSSREQRRWLRQLGDVSVDEIALDFDAVFGPATMDFHIYPSDLRAQLQAIDDLLNSMSVQGNRSLWTVSSLILAPEWKRIRREASRAVDSLGPLLQSWSKAN
ncbi:hypothetical protein [Leifsonia sp. LS-T14]|uniref:hypothetical protein n=1 Tax=unclassified Leifsonia TaxID=2663824 RepID=UPI0035A7450B